MSASPMTSSRRRLTRSPGRLYLAAEWAPGGFLLAPIAIVLVFALNPTPYIQFPAGRRHACAGSRSSSPAPSS